MHPLVKDLLRGAYGTGVKAVARAIDAVFEDVDAGAKEVSSRAKRARGKLKDIEARADASRHIDDNDDSTADSEDH